MKRSELRQIIREEIIRIQEDKLEEGLIDKVFDHLRKSVEDSAKQREVAKINKRVAQQVLKLSDAEEDLKKMLNKELTDAELDALLKKLS